MNIVYLYPRKLWDSKMSFGRIVYGEAAQNQPGTTLRFWGDGWPGYNPADTLGANLERLDAPAPTCLWLYKADTLKGVSGVPLPKVICFNEAWAPKTLDEIRAADAELVIFHHENDMAQWWFLETEGVRLVHLPHCADPEVFKPRSAFAERPIDCLATGVDSREVYPLRWRLKAMVTEGRIPGSTRPHPGYRLKSNSECRSQYLDYAEHLSRAKISLCCTSRHRYALAKQFEAAMSGCAVATDCPQDSVFTERLWPHCIQLDSTMDDIAICSTIRSWLSRPDELATLAERGRRAALEWFTTDHYAQRLLAEFSTLVRRNTPSESRVTGAA